MSLAVFFLRLMKDKIFPQRVSSDFYRERVEQLFEQDKLISMKLIISLTGDFVTIKISISAYLSRHSKTQIIVTISAMILPQSSM